MATGVSFKSDDEIEREEDEEHKGFAKPGSGQGIGDMTRLETLIKIRQSFLATDSKDKDFRLKLYKELNKEIDKICGA